jgi:hypothetical protein
LRRSDSATMERMPPGSEQTGQGSDEMDEKNDQIGHRRIVAGQETLRNHTRNNNSPATGYLLNCTIKASAEKG